YLEQFIDAIKNSYNNALKSKRDVILKSGQNIDNNESLEYSHYINIVEFNFLIIRFIWNLIIRIKSYDLDFQNIDKPLFRVYQSSLGKSEFANCNFEKFEFQYNSCNFYDCLFFSTDIPEDNLQILESSKNVINIEEIDLDNNAKINYYKQVSDFHNQFKKIYERQGNTFNSGIFNSKWAENHEKLLLLKLGKSETYLNNHNDFCSFIKSIKLFLCDCGDNNFETKQDIFTFNLNRISNRHGESWITSLMFISLPLFILFLFYVTSVYYDFINPYELFCEDAKFTFDYYFIDVYIYHFKDFFLFLNPARKLDFFNPIKNEGSIDAMANFIDIISRIILAYGIYQLIVAFRKNGKKH
ncbi:TPA: hypothetical protein ACG0AR_002353, partial [Elizabethkingia anophelis]